jgi:hypothetical protein
MKRCFYWKMNKRQETKKPMIPPRWDSLVFYIHIKLKKMKAGKKYYIKARAFVKGINGKKIYGVWTKAKRIKLK